MANKDLNKAKAAKKDEFYTRLEDIEKEMKYYRAHFKGKTILCNCDDPRCSNFFRYFTLNFEVLGLKKVIATCYKNQDVDLFSQHKCERAVYQVRRLSLCWPEVRQDQFIRLARQVNGQTVEFARGRFQHAYRHRDRPLVVTVNLEDPLYGRCIDLDIPLPKGDLATQAQGLKSGTILRHIRGALTVEECQPDTWSADMMRVLLKDASFEIDEK